MDNIDKKIIELLQESGRIPIVEITKQLHLSRPSVNERLRKLHEQGIIKKYTAVISADAIGKELQAILMIKNLKIPCRTFEGKIIDEAGILECHRVTGENSYYIKIAVSSKNELEQLIDRLIPFGTINTSIILSSPIENKPLLPD